MTEAQLIESLAAGRTLNMEDLVARYIVALNRNAYLESHIVLQEKSLRLALDTIMRTVSTMQGWPASFNSGDFLHGHLLAHLVETLHSLTSTCVMAPPVVIR